MRERAVQAVYLAGLHLLAGEERLPGPVRERLLVSYCRYSGQAGHSSHLDTVCQVQSHNTAGQEQFIVPLTLHVAQSTPSPPSPDRP